MKIPAYNIFNLLLPFILLLSFNEAKALHIIGGDVVYKCLKLDSISRTVRYQITFTMYRDSKSNGANFDDPTRFGIYRGSGNNWTFIRTVDEINVRDIKNIDIIDANNPCILVPVNVGVQSGVYVFEITLPIVNENYLIAYQRCCRNNTILNLVDPGSTGAAFTTEITPEAQMNCNNSPTMPIVLILLPRQVLFVWLCCRKSCFSF